MNLNSQFFFVIVLVSMRIDAQPFHIIKRDTTNNELDTTESNSYTFKLPTKISPELEITIHGTLDINQKSFIALLKSSESSSDCKLEYNFNSKTLTIIPPSLAEQEEVTYDLEMIPNETNTFILKVKAKATSVYPSPILDFTFVGNEHLKTGDSDILGCKIKNFEDLSYIVFKEGVKSVNTLMFTFP